MDDVFPGQRKMRRAELLTPPNTMKAKVGSGGLDAAILSRAQEALESANIDFQPQAFALLDDVMQAVISAQNGTLTGEDAVEQIIYPAMQLKAQGGMLQYPLVTEISNILINFLETVTTMDEDSIEITLAHRRALQAVLVGRMSGEGGKTGQTLRDALMDACTRYYRKNMI